jgi:DNA-binding IclR family transcriptional regulator
MSGAARSRAPVPPTAEPTAPPTVPPTVTGKVLCLLGAFAESRTELTLTELSALTGLPAATVHRLGQELVRWGALERDPRGPFRIGLRLWEVGSLAPRGLGLREKAMPFLEDLYEATHQNVQLAVLEGREAVYVERISGREAVGVVSRVGGRLPLHATGVGQVLLAYAPSSLQDEVMSGPLRRFTPRTVVDPTELRRVLAEVRRAGAAVCNGQVELRSLSVAAPVRGPGGEVVAALSIVVPSQGFDPVALVPAVRAAATGVSRTLGAPRAPLTDQVGRAGARVQAGAGRRPGGA